MMRNSKHMNFNLTTYKLSNSDFCFYFERFKFTCLGLLFSFFFNHRLKSNLKLVWLRILFIRSMFGILNVVFDKSILTLQSLILLVAPLYCVRCCLLWCDILNLKLNPTHYAVCRLCEDWLRIRKS